MTEHHSHIQSSRHSIKVQTIEATIANLAPKLGLCRCLHRSLCLARALVICVVVAALHLDRLQNGVPARTLAVLVRIGGSSSAEQAPVAAGAEEDGAAAGRLKKKSIRGRAAVSAALRDAEDRCARFLPAATPLSGASSSPDPDSTSSSATASSSNSDSAQHTHIMMS